MTAQYIKTDGTIKEISPANGRDFCLDELQQLVHGLIDIVSLPDSDMIFVVNDEGILLNMEQNIYASLLCSIHYKQSCALFGDVIYCHTKMVK